MILVSISLMVNHIEHLLMNLLVICKSSLEKCLFKFIGHVLTGFLSFTRDGKSLVCILNIAHYQIDTYFQIFFPILWLSLIFMMVSSVTKHFHFGGTKSTCIFLSLLLLVSYLRRFCATGG